MTEIQPISVVRSPRIENMDMNSRSHELHLMNIMKITTINQYQNIFYIQDYLNVASLLIFSQRIILHFNLTKNLFMYIMWTTKTHFLLEGLQLKSTCKEGREILRTSWCLQNSSDSILNILGHDYLIIWRNINDWRMYKVWTSPTID